MSGTLYGIGVGPGDPELITQKGARLIGQTPVIAYLCNHAGHSRARETASACLRSDHEEISIPMRFEYDRSAANRAYDHAAERIARALNRGQDVALLCEGDPLLYGSFVYMLQRLQSRYPCVIVPGISAVGAASAAAGIPLTTQRQALVVIPAHAGEDRLRATLENYEAVAILKPGKERPVVLRLLRETGRLGDAVYVEQVTRENELIVRDLDSLAASPGPYFSLFLVSRS